MNRAANVHRHLFTGGVLVVCAAAFAIGIQLSRNYDLELSVERTAQAASSAGEYRPEYQRVEGPELVFLYVGSSSCRWSNDPRLPAAVEALKVQLATYAHERDMAFRAIGVSVDWVPETGLKHLSAFGIFDELSVGSNWMNETLMTNVWERGQPLATPAVVIHRREILLIGDRDSGEIHRLGRENYELLLLRNGPEQIQALSEMGPARFLSLNPPSEGHVTEASEERGRN